MVCWVGLEFWFYIEEYVKILDDLGYFLLDWGGYYERWIVKGDRLEFRFLY